MHVEYSCNSYVYEFSYLYPFWVSFDCLLFFFTWGHIFLLLCILVNVEWMPDIVDFTLLDAGYSCIFKK